MLDDLTHGFRMSLRVIAALLGFAPVFALVAFFIWALLALTGYA